MTIAPPVDGPTANLVETYFRLAQATPGASLWWRGNVRGCTGAFAHPICNFAVALDLTEVDVQELGQIVATRDPFQVYVLQSGSRVSDDHRLAAIGLRPAYRLRQMEADPLYVPPRIQPVEAKTYAARLALAKFMVGQFFLAQPRQFREGIARATARAGGLDLYAVSCQDSVIGGMMLCRVGRTLGLYNLCVAPDFRNQGWGRSILEWTRAVAAIEGRTVALQCDERLVTWYQSSGFIESGEICAYARSAPAGFDTM